LGAEGRGFESLRPDHRINHLANSGNRLETHCSEDCSGSVISLDPWSWFKVNPKPGVQMLYFRRWHPLKNAGRPQIPPWLSGRRSSVRGDAGESRSLTNDLTHCALSSAKPSTQITEMTHCQLFAFLPKRRHALRIESVAAYSFVKSTKPHIAGDNIADVAILTMACRATL
jgi:hypothetical protein